MNEEFNQNLDKKISKIKIPWYRRTINGLNNDTGNNSVSFHLPPNPTPKAEPIIQEPVRQAVTQPSTNLVNSPIKSPSTQPIWNPLPLPFPIPERKPNSPAPVPTPAPIPIPLTAENSGITGDFEKAFERIAKPILTLFALNKAKDDYIKVKVTDPVYNKMLADPVLGSALREAEKSNMDTEALGTYFANYDWNNFNDEQMLKELGALIGVAGAARIIVFIIGRKVLFKI